MFIFMSRRQVAVGGEENVRRKEIWRQHLFNGRYFTHVVPVLTRYFRTFQMSWLHVSYLARNREFWGVPVTGFDKSRAAEAMSPITQ